MALIVKDRVQETTTTSGTGTITLAGAVSGFQSFAAIGNGNTTYYTIVDGTSWEVGIGTYTSAGTTLSRDTVLSNSLGTTAKISLSGGTSQVFVTYAAGKSVYQDASGYVSGYTIENSAIGATTASTGKFTTLQSTGNTLLNTSSGYTAIADTSTVGQFGVKLGTGFSAGGTWDSRAVLFGNINTATGAGSGALGLSFDTTAGASIMSIAPNLAWYNMQYLGNTHRFYGLGFEQLRVLPINSAANYVQVQGATTGNQPFLWVGGTDTNISLGITSKGNGALNLSTNSGNNLQLQLPHTASAVNYVQVTGGITGNNGVISAQGSDSSIGLTFSAKNAGNILFQAAGGTNFETRYTATTPINYLSATGSLTTIAPTLSSRGNDTNIAMGLISKGTGAIDLAAGSSGVNISNGGTVTAITRVTGGSGYTTVLTATISAPTTAGGVQATMSAGVGATTQAIAGGGTGYTVGDILNVVGGTIINSALQQIRVDTVSGGVITGISIAGYGQYTVLPTNPVSVTGGTGTGATFNLSSWSFTGSTITNAGSGYIEQPTVTFSGGGGSGASAFASIGTTPVIKALANTMQIATSMGSALDLTNYGANQTTNRYALFASATGNPAIIEPRGDTNINAVLSSRGTGAVQFYTNGFSGGGTGLLQLNVSHTASAVNYVQVTGNVTTGPVTISSQGSDANVSAQITTKGSGSLSVFSNNGSNRQFRIDGTTTAVNYLDVYGSIAGAAPSVRVAGSDTNIDLALTPKGTGGVAINSAIKLGAGASAGTSGQVLTSAGAGASPTWSSVSGGGMTTLGTISFSGTNQQFSLTGLTLTSYKQLYIVMNGINQGTTGSGNLSISGLSGDQTATYWSVQMGAAGTQNWLYGAFFVDLVTGITIGGASYARPTASTSMPLTSTTGIPNANQASITSISNSSTAVYVYFTSATGTRSGTLTVYGIA